MAIVLVVLFHAFPSVVPGGFIGVDVFFVISGFLIGGVLLDSMGEGGFTLRAFYARRIRRIFPALLPVLAVVLVFGWLTLLAAEFKALGLDVAAGAGFVANFELWGEANYFDRASQSKLLLHLWSLGIEEQFYVVWPLLLAALHFIFAGSKKSLMQAVLVAVSLASFAYCVWRSVPASQAEAFYSPLARCWELAAGTVLAIAVRRPLTFSPMAALCSSLAGVALIALSAVTLWAEVVLPGAFVLPSVIGAVFVIAAGERSSFNRVVLSSKAFTTLGVISYSTYLWHWPLLSGLRILARGEPPALERAEVVLLSFLLGALSLRVIEQPIRTSKPRVLTIVALVAAMAGLVVAGLAVYASGGVPSRYPRLIREVTDVRFQAKNEFRTGLCFADHTQTSSSFSPICLEAGRPLVFLWGDSHAAALYHGLKTLQVTQHFAIAQYTASSCAPMLGIENPGREFCKRINDTVIAKIEEAKPEAVLLEAGWFTGSVKYYGVAYDANYLTDTIRELRRIGVPHIVLIGPSPHWPDGGVRRLLHEAWELDPFNEELPARLVPTTWPSVVKSDAQARAVAAKFGIQYVSVVDTMCNAEGCLTRVGSKGYNVTTVDAVHLTPVATDYVVNTLFDSHQLEFLRAK